MHGWTVVLMSLAGTVLLVGGVGVLSVMLISFSDRRYEIGLRKAMGASDGEIFVQFLLEACVLAAVGASVGTFFGAAALQGALVEVPLRPRRQPRRPPDRLGDRARPRGRLRPVPGDPGLPSVADGGDEINVPDRLRERSTPATGMRRSGTPHTSPPATAGGEAG